MVFVSDVPLVEQGHGGGNVAYIEASVLQKMGKLDAVIAPQAGESPFQVPVFDNSPEKWGVPRSQYTTDYFSCEIMLAKAINQSCLFTNGSGFALTAEIADEIRYRDGVKEWPIIVDCPAHSLKDTIAEHVKFMGRYPYNNLTDPFLFDISTRHQQLADMIIVPSEAITLAAPMLKQ